MKTLKKLLWLAIDTVTTIAVCRDAWGGYYKPDNFGTKIPNKDKVQNPVK